MLRAMWKEIRARTPERTPASSVRGHAQKRFLRDILRRIGIEQRRGVADDLAAVPAHQLRQGSRVAATDVYDQVVIARALETVERLAGEGTVGERTMW